MTGREKRRLRSGSWRVYVHVRACELGGELRSLGFPPPGRLNGRETASITGDEARAAATWNALDSARDATGIWDDTGSSTHLPSEAPRGRRTHFNWLTGSLNEEAFQHLHSAEVTMIRLLKDPEEISARIPDAVSKLRRAVKDKSDFRLVAADTDLTAFWKQSREQSPPGVVIVTSTAASVDEPATLASAPSVAAPERTRTEVDTAASTNGVEDDAVKIGGKPAPAVSERTTGNCDAVLRARVALARAVAASYDISDQAHSRLRNFRNIVLAATVTLTLIVGALCLIGAARPSAIAMCFNPSSSTPAPPSGGEPGGAEEFEVCPTRAGGPVVPTGGDVLLVAFFGLVGGAAAAVLGISQLQGTSTPYKVPLALAVLKLPLGALAAVLGIVLVRGDFVPGLSQLDNQAQILTYALVFGIAQQAFTRFVDRQGHRVLEAIPSKEKSPATPGPATIAGSESTDAFRTTDLYERTVTETTRIS